MRLALCDRVEVLAAILMAKELVCPVEELVPLQLLGGHEGHGAGAALKVVLLHPAVALGHVAQIGLLLEEDLLAALANGQALGTPIQLLFAAQKAAGILKWRNDN